MNLAHNIFRHNSWTKFKGQINESTKDLILRMQDKLIFLFEEEKSIVETVGQLHR